MRNDQPISQGVADRDDVESPIALVDPVEPDEAVWVSIEQAISSSDPTAGPATSRARRGPAFVSGT